MLTFRNIFIFIVISVGLSGCTGQPPLAKSDDSIRLKTGWLRSAPPVKTWKAGQTHNVVMQRFDYSCGAGALATLLNFYFGEAIGEEDILVSILSPMTEEQVLDRENNGLSMLDLKNCAERKGYQAVGVKLNFAALKQLKGPIIIHLESEGYKHFAVLKGIWGDRIFLADPSRGNIRLPAYRFVGEWTGAALIIGKKGFGLPREYPLALSNQDLARPELQAARGALFK